MPDLYSRALTQLRGEDIAAAPLRESDPVVWVEETQPNIQSKVKAYRGRAPFLPWPHQKAIMRMVANYDSFICEKSRQTGISTAVVMSYAHQLIYGRPFQAHLLAHTENAGIERLLNIAKLALETATLDKNIRSKINLGGVHTPIITYEGPYSRNYIRVHAAAPGAGRSFDGNAVLLEEVAFMQYTREIWSALSPMLDDGRTMVQMLSTHNPADTFFREMCDNAEAMGMSVVQIPWNSRPDRDEEWKAQSQARFQGRLEDWEAEHDLLRQTLGTQAIHMETVEQFAQKTEWGGTGPYPGRTYSKGADISSRGKDPTVFTAVDITLRPAQVVYTRAYPSLSTEDLISVMEDFDRLYPGPLWIDGTVDTAICSLVKSNNKRPVRFGGGSNYTTRFDASNRLTWHNVPRRLMLSWLVSNLESGRVVCHTSRFPELKEALQTCTIEDMTVGKKAKLMGKHPDYLDSLMLANLALARKDLGSNVAGPSDGRSPSPLDHIRHRRW